MEYKDCGNCRHFQDDLKLPETPQCKKCSVPVERLTPTKWRRMLEKDDKRFYTNGQINFTSMRDAVREAMRERSERQFRAEFGKAINTVLKWLVARKIERQQYDALCVWLKCSKTIFITKSFKKRMPYYAKSEHSRMAGRQVK